MREILKVRMAMFPPHLLQVCRTGQDSGWHRTCRTHSPLLLDIQSPLNTPTIIHRVLWTGRVDRQSWKKPQVRYFLQDGSISALLLVMISDQSFGVFFLFQSEKEQTGVKKWKTLQPSPFLRQKLNGKNTGTAWLKLWLIYSYYDSNWLSTVIWVYTSCRNKH